MPILLTDLPYELLEMIANRIKDTQGYFSFRHSCRKCYLSTRFLKKYHSTGEILEIIPIRNFLPHGKVITYFKNGQIATFKEYNEGIQIKNEILYYFSGKTLVKSIFDNGKLNGICYWYNIDGSIHKILNFKNNLLHGKNLYFSNRGLKICQGYYFNDLAHGKFEFYNNNISCINFSAYNGKINGPIAIYSNDNFLRYFGHVVDELFHGRQYFYDNFENLKTIVPFVYGRIHGTRKRYYNNGHLLSIVRFIKNMKHGREKIWYEDGSIRAIKNWKENKKHGVFKFYDPEGKPLLKCFFNENKLDGSYYKYSNGILNKITYYKNGEISDFVIYFNDLVERIEKIVFIDNDTIRNIISFIEDSKLEVYASRIENYKYTIYSYTHDENNIENYSIELNGIKMSKILRNDKLISTSLSKNDSLVL